MRLRIAALMVSASAFAASAAPPVTPAAIEASIRRDGPEATIATLSKSDQWDMVTDKMGSGAAAWIALAPKLAPGADAGGAEDLGISLAFSLPKNAKAVLSAIDPTNGHIIGADRVCGAPFIEETVKNLGAYKRRAIRAVEAVSDPSLADVRSACLSALKTS